MSLVYIIRCLWNWNWQSEVFKLRTNAYSKLAKSIKDSSKKEVFYSGNVFLGEIITGSPLKILVNGLELTEDNVYAKEGIDFSKVKPGEVFIVFKITPRQYVISDKVVKI